MKKNKAPEFPPDLLATIAPEKREEFKRIARKKRYLGSGLFLFFWHVNLWALCYPFVRALLQVYESFDGELNRLFSHFGAVILSFFLAVLLSFLSKKIRLSLNQIGINVTHAVTISLVIFYGLWWWLGDIPARGY